MKPIQAFHFLAQDEKLQFGDGRRPKVGVPLSAEGELKMCNNGMHASRDLMVALDHAPGPILCRVELSGERLVSDDGKLCARTRTVLAKADVSATLHQFALKVARRALRKAKVKDPRCWNALAVKEKWLKGEATDEELRKAQEGARAVLETTSAVALATAWGAARETAWAAHEAASAASRASEPAWWAAARGTARTALAAASAASADARAAAWATWAAQEAAQEAASEAERAYQRRTLRAMLRKEHPELFVK